jgi:hypothetical protein
VNACAFGSADLAPDAKLLPSADTLERRTIQAYDFTRGAESMSIVIASVCPMPLL